MKNIIFLTILINLYSCTNKVLIKKHYSNIDNSESLYLLNNNRYIYQLTSNNNDCYEITGKYKICLNTLFLYNSFIFPKDSLNIIEKKENNQDSIYIYIYHFFDSYYFNTAEIIINNNDSLKYILNPLDKGKIIIPKMKIDSIYLKIPQNSKENKKYIFKINTEKFNSFYIYTFTNITFEIDVDYNSIFPFSTKKYKIKKRQLIDKDYKGYGMPPYSVLKKMSTIKEKPICKNQIILKVP